MTISRQRYITRNLHTSHHSDGHISQHLAGEECWASRKNCRIIVLEYDNGDVVELVDHYLEGLEPRTPSFEDQILCICEECAVREIQKIEDKAVIKILADILPQDPDDERLVANRVNEVMGSIKVRSI